MTLDPEEVVKAARANGEPQLAEWLQAEVDQIGREKRNGRLIAALCVVAFWAVIIALVWWGLS